MSDTPRTDAVWEKFETDLRGKLEPDGEFSALACQLERELNAAHESLLYARGIHIQKQIALDKANHRIKRLEEAGDAVAAIIGPPGSAHWADENQVDAAWNNWTKAKEAK